MASEVNSNEQSDSACREESNVKRAWHAPQLETVSINGLTEHMFNTGSDGSGVWTFS